VWGPNGVSEEGIGEPCVGQCEAGISLDGALKILRALIDLREGPLVQVKAAFEVKLISIRIWGVFVD
jgi:hypothetical protein